MKIINIEKNKNNIVKKAKELIKAKGELSQTAQKMLSMLISMIRTDDTEFQTYALSISEYKKEIESNSKKSKNDFINNAKELMSKPFIVDKKMFNWCSLVDWGSLNGYLIFKIDNELKPYLLQLRDGNFLQYNITNIMKLKGKYSPRLYEYFKMRWNEYKAYNKDKKSYTFELKIDWLRNFLKITKGYRYDNIKKQIIEKAKEDFKKYTDIQFTYKEQKIGRRVDRLIIIIKENTQGSNKFLSNIKTFISFVRTKYKGTPKAFFALIQKKQDGTIKKIFYKIDNEEYLYSNEYNTDGSGNLKKYNQKEAKEQYEKIFNYIKQNQTFQEMIFEGKDFYELE